MASQTVTTLKNPHTTNRCPPTVPFPLGTTFIFFSGFGLVQQPTVPFICIHPARFKFEQTPLEPAREQFLDVLSAMAVGLLVASEVLVE